MAKSSPSAFSPRPPHAPNAQAGGGVLRAEVLHAELPAVPSLGTLWQMPLLLVSLGLFTLAAYLFIDPRPAPTFQAQLAKAQRDVEAERFDAAVGRLNDLLATVPEERDAAAARLLVAEALDLQMRRSRRAESPQAHRRVVAEITAAYAAGAAPTVDTADRLARSHEALGDVDKAAANWSTAVSLLEQAERPEQGVPMRRSAIEMLVGSDRQVAATDALKAFLDVPGIGDDERAWALGELARMSIDDNRPGEARTFLSLALNLSPDEAIKGQVNFRLGYAAWRLGEEAEAERYLKQAREQLGTGHHLDAEACFLLGRIAQNREAPVEADAFYEIVLRDHPQSRSALPARIGRGVIKLVQGNDDEGVADLSAAAQESSRKPAAVNKADLLDALQRGGRILAGRGKYEQALELLACEQQIDPDPPAEFFARLGLYLENLADATDTKLADAEDPQRPGLENAARGLRKRAGDAYVAYSRKLTLTDDKAYGEALWKGVELYERAANLPETVAALELFCAERPTDPIVPDAMYRLGRAYQALGQQARATETFLRLRGRYPQSLAAAEAAVPLAQAYVAQGAEKYPEAEGVLRSVTDDNPVLSPESHAFRGALWELGQLYYRVGRYGEALARFEEFAGRYDAGERAAQLTFLKADCYRLAAAQKRADGKRPADPLTPGDAQLARGTARGSAGVAELVTPVVDPEVRRFLEQAKGLFDDALGLYERAAPATPLDQTYQRLAYFYRADCAFDLGNFDDAIKLYDAAAYRFQDDPASLAAYVQIVNAYCALGRPADAKAANERAKWLLKRIPAEAFGGGPAHLSRDGWERWLHWAGQAGNW